uniref:Uncharacterized protein n=1 Tax=Romanomermis culicivorax TaxID=13658 RepID=A0A915ISF2_ROMCU
MTEPVTQQGHISDMDYLKTVPSRKRRKIIKSACPDETSVVSGDDEMVHQSIKFMEFQREQWHKLCDINGKEMYAEVDPCIIMVSLTCPFGLPSHR